MKPLNIFLIFSLSIAQEFSIDGDLSVSGNINNSTIDSLKLVIESLENSLESIQSGYGERFIELTIQTDYGEGYVLFDFDDAIGSNNNWYKLEPVHVLAWDGIQGYFNIQMDDTNGWGRIDVNKQSNDDRPRISNNGPIYLFSENGQHNLRVLGGGRSSSVDILLRVTSDWSN